MGVGGSHRPRTLPCARAGREGRACEPGPIPGREERRQRRTCPRRSHPRGGGEGGPGWGGGVTSTARSAVRASGEGRASVRAWTYLGEGSGVNGGPAPTSTGGRACGAKGPWYSRGIVGRRGGGERARGGGGGVSGGDAPWYGERERERGVSARAGRGRREACLAGGHGAVLVSSAAGAAEATIPPSCRGERELEWRQTRGGGHQVSGRRTLPAALNYRSIVGGGGGSGSGGGRQLPPLLPGRA